MPINSPVIHKGRLGTQSGADGRPLFHRCRTHKNIDILEDLARGDAAAAVRGLDQIVTRLATMFATERVDKREGLSELLCLDQETRAIDVPFCGRFPHVLSPLGEGEQICDYVLAETLLRVRRIYSRDRVRSIPKYWCNWCGRCRHFHI